MIKLILIEDNKMILAEPFRVRKRRDAPAAIRKYVHSKKFSKRFNRNCPSDIAPADVKKDEKVLFSLFDKRCLEYGLTQREKEIMQHKIERKATKNAAGAMSIADRTAETFLQKIYKKLNVSTIADAIHRLTT
jgi:DNA-binding CsgD family transcriptional regulator